MALSEPAIRLLLALLDQPRPVLSGPAMNDFHAASGRELLAAGLLVPDGHEATDTGREHEDAPVALTASDDSPGLGYFSPVSGWVSVDPSRLTRYRVDRQAVAEALAGQTRQAGRRAGSTANDNVWDLGQIRLPGRRRRVAALLLRRVADPAVWKEVRQWLIRNPSGDRRVLICAAPADRLPDDPPHGNVMMSLADVLDADGEPLLDPQVVAARIDLPAGITQTSDPIVVLGDGREVRLHGAVFRFSRGVVQRRIICALHQRYLNGELEVATAALVSELDLPDKARIEQYFKHCNPPVLDRLIWVKAGLCGFCLKP